MLLPDALDRRVPLSHEGSRHRGRSDGIHFPERMTGTARTPPAGCIFGNETALFRLSSGAVARVCEYRRIGTWATRGQPLRSDASFVEGPAGCHWVTKTEKTPLIRRSRCATRCQPRSRRCTARVPRRAGTATSTAGTAARTRTWQRVRASHSAEPSAGGQRLAGGAILRAGA